MKKWILWPLLTIVMLAAACAGSPQMVEVEATGAAADIETEIIEREVVEESGEPVLMATSVPSAEAAVAFVFDDAGKVTALATPEIALESEAVTVGERQQTRQRLIIKNGQMTIETTTAGEAVTAVANLAAATGGYIISQRVWDQNGYTFATMQIGVPVTEFERAMEQIRKLGEVKQDTASGQDVTDEFVDLNSRLKTLEITQERLQTFLAEANKIEDIIKLNNELTRIEEQINVIRGRMNYLADRAAFSTITVQIDPVIPEPTPTPTLTPTPIPDPEPWMVSSTATRATRQLQNSTRSVVDFVVYNAIVCGPWLFMIALGGYIGLRIWLRLQARNTFLMNSAPVRSTAQNQAEEN